MYEHIHKHIISGWDTIYTSDGVVISGSNDSSTEAEHSSVTVTIDGQETVDQTVDDIGLEGMMAPLMFPEPPQLEFIEFPRVGVVDPNMAPAAPPRQPRRIARRRNRRRRRVRFLRDINEQGPRARPRLAEEPIAGDARAEEMVVSAGGSNASRRGRRPRTTPIQIAPPLYLNLKRDEYEWFLPDYDV